MISILILQSVYAFQPHPCINYNGERRVGRVEGRRPLAIYNANGGTQ